jgi:hypothetical protein
LIGRAVGDAKRTGCEVLMVCLYYMTQDWRQPPYRDEFDIEEVSMDEILKILIRVIRSIRGSTPCQTRVFQNVPIGNKRG